MGGIVFGDGAVVSAQSGGAGTVNLSTSGSINIGKSRITADTAGQGGSVLLSARNDFRITDSLVSSTAGQEGNIGLTAGDLLLLGNSTVTAQASKAGGGKITLDPTYVVLENTTINGLSAGKPVQVAFDPNVILLRSQSQILTQSLILPPITDVAGFLISLPPAVPQSSLGLAPFCAPRLNAEFSSFVITGQSGTPPQPGGWMLDLSPVGAPAGSE